MSSPKKRASTGGSGRIICLAIDESSHSKKAAQWIRDNIVFQPADRLYIVTVAVIPDSPVFALADPVFSTKLDSIKMQLKLQVKENAQNLVDSVAATFHSSCKDVKTIVKDTIDVRETLCGLVKEIAPSTLVMGSRGMGMVKTVLLGSVSTFCAQHCHCTVVLVK